jgi:hypothetical protein
MSELTVDGCTFKASISPALGSISAPNITSPQKETEASKKVLAGTGVYFQKITAQIEAGASVNLSTPPAGATAGSGQLMAPAPVVINGTASKILVEGKNAVQKGDYGEADIQFIFPGPNGSTVPGTVHVKVEVDDPGQSDVVAL